MKTYMRNVISVTIALIMIITILDNPTHAEETKTDYQLCVSSIRIEGGDTLSELSKEWYNNDNFDNSLRWESYKDYMDEVVSINNLPSKDRITAGNYLAMPYVIQK